MSEDVEITDAAKALLKKAAVLLTALSEGKKLECLDGYGLWCPVTFLIYSDIVKHPEGYRVAPPLCAMCKHPQARHGMVGCQIRMDGTEFGPFCDCKGYVDPEVYGEKPVPPPGCELLPPGESSSNYYYTGGAWELNRFYPGMGYSEPFWRANNKVMQGELTSGMAFPDGHDRYKTKPGTCTCHSIGGNTAVCPAREKPAEPAPASSDFYKRRVELLQEQQKYMRDPERSLVCDILANAQLLPDPEGIRYGKRVECLCELVGMRHCPLHKTTGTILTGLEMLVEMIKIQPPGNPRFDFLREEYFKQREARTSAGQV